MVRELRLRLEWLMGRLKWELREISPFDLGGHSMPWWRWKNYRLFYSRRDREERGQTDRPESSSSGASRSSSSEN